MVTPAETILLLTSTTALILWIENMLQHWEEKFFNWRMWIPVFYVPLFYLFGYLTYFNRGLVSFFQYSAYGLILVALIGLFYHFLHVLRKGLTLQNIAKGRPPVFLPLSYIVLSFLALAVSSLV